MDLSAAPPGLDCLVVSGVEREPYLTCDQRLMIEQAARIVIGLQILQRLLKPSSILLGIDERLVEARDRLERAAAEAGLDWRVAPLQSRYPQADERLLMRALFGGSAARKAAPNSFVVGAAALHAVYEAVVLSRPVLERVVTVTGLAVRRPSNLKVRLGARLGHLIEECGGFAEPPALLVAGGPMTGSAQLDLEAPVSRELPGLLALSRAEIRGAAGTSCIGCGRCLEACPWGLAPVQLYKAVEHRRLDRRILAELQQCTECGCCAYVCPARLPLVAGLHRGRLLAQRN